MPFTPHERKTIEPPELTLMKTTLLTSPPRWMKLAAVMLVGVWTADTDAAYWNRNRNQSQKSSTRDLDGDGIPNVVDPDIDNDGIPNALDKNIDGGIALTGPFAGKQIGDSSDNDSASEDDIDDDGLPDDSLGEKDIDGDGKLNDDSTEKDIDGDGRDDDSTAERDIDGDGRDDDSANEDDIDGDGRSDDDPLEHDIDGDGKDDSSDDDIDGDGKSNDDPADTDEDGDGKQNDDPADTDEDGDGVSDRNDNDDNNNGIADVDDSGHHPEDGESEVTSDLVAGPAAPNNSSVKVTLQTFGTGSSKFVVDARDLVVGSYELLVNDIVRGTLSVVQVSSKTRGTLVFKTADSGSGDLLLDFPVSTQPIALRQGGIVYFSGTAPTAGSSTDTGDVGAGTVVLTRAPSVPNEAQAEASLEFGTAGPTELQIQVEKVPAGEYAVIIGEALRGTVSVTASPPANPSGTLVFKVTPEGAELPLNFPVAGQSISIAQDGVSVFFGQLPTAPNPPAP